ncbi:SDR family NAD(P)-dependent oxidoreductase [Ruicaihuangia caeni]|uniref:SDR family NAD(P)-dependent oxidoreductase n=1 Tax=Ruicaihuangia caeni TaxID=3042517 RepID=UPI00338E3552
MSGTTASVAAATPAAEPISAGVLVGATALVTGAAGGMGRAITRALAAAGASTIYALDRVAADDDHVDSIVVDLADLDTLAGTIRGLERTPQIVVNAAGYYAWREGFEIDTADFTRTFDINVGAPFVIMREVARRLEAEGGVADAAFVNIASVAAKRGFPNQADYVASKGALVSLTRAAAQDLAPRITVNAIAPGTVNTPMIDQVARDIAAKTGLPFAEQRAALTADIPTGRMQEPNEIAAAVVFLASTGARSISGETLALDGGVSRD